MTQHPPRSGSLNMEVKILQDMGTGLDYHTYILVRRHLSELYIVQFDTNIFCPLNFLSTAKSYDFIFRYINSKRLHFAPISKFAQASL